MLCPQLLSIIELKISGEVYASIYIAIFFLAEKEDYKKILTTL